MTILLPEPLTAAAFAAFGDVIAGRETAAAMNAGAFARSDCAAPDLITDPPGHAVIGVVRCQTTTATPIVVDLVERHPLGSQAFIPLGAAPLLVVVASPGLERITATDLHAFVGAPRQGVQYHRGTWHAPLMGFGLGDEYLVIDRLGAGDNCTIQTLDPPLRINWSP